MKRYLLLASIILGLFTISCNDPDKVSPDNNEFLKCWTSSIEESVGVDGDLFRPCDFMVFPDAEFRNRFTLFENNEGTFLQMSPIDAHEDIPVTWNYDDLTKRLTVKRSSGDTIFSHLVVTIEPDQLILKAN